MRNFNTENYSLKNTGVLGRISSYDQVPPFEEVMLRIHSVIGKTKQKIIQTH